MAFFKKERKDDYYSQAMKIEHTPSKKSSLERRRNKMIATYNEPVLPKVAKILFISMFVITAAVLAVEIVNFTRYLEVYDVSRLLNNLTLTCLVFWGIYTVFLAIVSLFGMKFQTDEYNKKKTDAGIIDRTDEEKERSKKAVKRLNSVYIKYIFVSAAGLLFWLIFFAVVRII